MNAYKHATPIDKYEKSYQSIEILTLKRSGINSYLFEIIFN